MEDIKTFEQWLAEMLENSKIELGMTNETIAWILLREGTIYYFKTIVSRKTSLDG